MTHLIDALRELADEIHRRNVAAGWWDPERSSGEFCTKLALCHSELSEALEGYRKDLMDDKLPHRPMAEVELADTLIRVLDLAVGSGYDIAGAVAEKLAYNAVREDHKIEVRSRTNEKKF